MIKQFAVYRTKLGYYRIEEEKDAITLLKRMDDAPADMGTPTALTDLAYQQLSEYLEGKRKKFDFPYELKGTDFQKKVWKSLCDIPYGETRTYKQIAMAAGNDKASRAVGMANNKNPISIAVPCHRVIGSDGALKGYAGGLEVKEYLLKMERDGVKMVSDTRNDT